MSGNQQSLFQPSAFCEYAEGPCHQYWTGM